MPLNVYLDLFKAFFKAIYIRILFLDLILPEAIVEHIIALRARWAVKNIQLTKFTPKNNQI